MVGLAEQSPVNVHRMLWTLPGLLLVAGARAGTPT